MIPGMGHCGGGDGPFVFDAIATLDTWVETDRAPERIVVSNPPNAPARTRPICPFPQQAVHSGSGSTDDEKNFRCVDQREARRVTRLTRATVGDEAFTCRERVVRAVSALFIPRALEKDGVPVILGNRALDILIVLVERAGEVVSHKELISRVWRDLVVEPGNLRVNMRALRKALGEGEDGARYIENVTGQGYSFVAPVQRAGYAAGVTGFSATTSPWQTATFDATSSQSRTAGLHATAPHSRTTALHANPPASQTPRPRALPPALARMIGRDDTVRTIAADLRTDRFVTLVGPGGMGKTTVAVSVAYAMLDGVRRQRVLRRPRRPR